jgi:hypothetical protein
VSEMCDGYASPVPPGVISFSELPARRGIGRMFVPGARARRDGTLQPILVDDSELHAARTHAVRGKGSKYWLLRPELDPGRLT